MNHSLICYGCMEVKEEEQVCSKCGWEENAEQASPIFLKPGTVLNGKYLLGRVLGHGGFGITYLARDLNLGVRLAIKEYLPQDMATRNLGDTSIMVYSGSTREHFEYGLDKFLEEARTLAKFDDVPEIVTIKDFFKENGTAYIVMSYVEGITLKEFITSRGGKLPLDAVLNIMLPVMKALEQVHSSGILHRDISPDNIYITRNFNVKLLDFGAARFAMGEHSKSMSVLLKPGYAPVEQYRSKGKQGPWTDIYAVAATMYKALTGNTPPESLDRMYEDVLAAPSKCDVDIPSNIEEALLKAMSIREEQRFQTVSEFSDCLQNRALSGIDDRKATDPAKLSNVSSQPVQSVQAQTSSDLKQEKDELTQKTQQPAKIVCENCGMRNPSYIPSCLSCGKSLKGEKKIIASSMTFEPIKEKKERNILEMLGSIQDNKQYKICGKCSFKNPPSRHYCSNCSASLK